MINAPRVLLTASTISLLALAGGCASGGAAAGQPKVVTAATDAQKKLMIDQVKQLVGTWEMTDEKGVRRTACVFSLSSAGSAVREVMFPGEDHEMTNVYHMDGECLVVTHYCAQGNQPRMRCCSATLGKLVFTFDSVTNLRSAGEEYMGNLTLEIKDKNSLVEHWSSTKAGKSDEHVTFTLTRKM